MSKKVKNKVVNVEVKSTKKGNVMKAQTELVKDTIAELQAQVDAGTMTTSIMDEIVLSIAEEVVAPTVKVEVEPEESNWVPQFTVRDRFMDLALNRGLTMAQNARDFGKIKAVVDPMIEPNELGYSPENWLIAMQVMADKCSDRMHAFTLARAINLTMRGITLTLYDRLSGKGKGQGTSVDAKLADCHRKIQDAEERGKCATADYWRNELLALELAQGDEQEDSRAYAGTNYLESPLPLDYEFLMDVANDYLELAEIVYNKLNISSASSDTMAFEVWSVNKYASTPDIAPDWQPIQNFEDALQALEDANTIRELEAKNSAQKLAEMAVRAQAEIHGKAKMAKEAELKAKRAEQAQLAIAKAQARVLQASKDRGLGKAEYRLDAWAKKNLTDVQLLEALVEIVDTNESLVKTDVEKFIKEYCDSRELAMPVVA